MTQVSDDHIRRLLLITSVGANIALLCFFKYTGWLSDALVSFGAISGFAVLTAGFHPPLPPGVSFYTFETISYTADVYKRTYRPRGNILDYMSFLVFFRTLSLVPFAGLHNRFQSFRKFALR